MKRTRGFEVAKGYEDKNINLPIRQTSNAAGYDFEAAEDAVIKPFSKGCLPTVVHTGVKAYMQEDEVLCLYDRSSNPKKKGIVLSNSVGIVDSDYYGNPDNDGEIMLQFYNTREEDVIIKKGDRIAQGLFHKFLITDNDNAAGKRLGGIGSTK